jgi:hypothetical protein
MRPAFNEAAILQLVEQPANVTGVISMRRASLF